MRCECKHPSFLPSWICWEELDWKPVVAKTYLWFNVSRLGSESCLYGCYTLSGTVLHFRSRLSSSRCAWTFNFCEIFNFLVSGSLVPRPSSKVATNKQAIKHAHAHTQCLQSPSCGAHSTLPNKTFEGLRNSNWLHWPFSYVDSCVHYETVQAVNASILPSFPPSFLSMKGSWP